MCFIGGNVRQIRMLAAVELRAVHIKLVGDHLFDTGTNGPYFKA